MSRHRRGFQWPVWGAPIALAMISAIGLIAGLLGDGTWDVASWIGLGLPVAVCLWYGWLRRARERRRPLLRFFAKIGGRR